MDHARIIALAARHAAQLDASQRGAALRTTLTPNEVFDRDYPGIVQRLSDAAEQYCDAYNTGIGSQKLITNKHDHGVNVYPHARNLVGARVHFNKERHRMGLCVVEIDDFSEPFRVGLRREADALILTLDDHPITEEALMVALLDRFTEKLTEIECEEL